MLALAAGARAQTADEVVARNLQAKGGVDKLKAVQSVKATSTLTMQGIEGKMIVLGKRPSMLRQEIDFGAQKIVSAYDGTTAWATPMGSTTPEALAGPQADLMIEQANFDGPLMEPKARGYTVVLVGTETIDGKSAHHLKVSAKSGIVHDYYLDATTGLELRLVTEVAGTSVRQDFSDYRDVQGLKVPFLIRTFVNGAPVGEIKVSAVEYNAAIDDAVFRTKK
jgi:hypothetical protein